MKGADIKPYDHAGNAIEMLDPNIARLNEILRQIDELEDDFNRIKHIRDILRGYRQRVDQMEKSIEQSGSQGEGP